MELVDYQHPGTALPEQVKRLVPQLGGRERFPVRRRNRFRIDRWSDFSSATGGDSTMTILA